MRCKQQSRKELRAPAQSFDDELLALQHEFHALIERSARPGMLLH
jgi:hypothetical protein